MARACASGVIRQADAESALGPPLTEVENRRDLQETHMLNELFGKLKLE